MPKKKKALTFDERMTALDTLVRQLETGELALEEALSTFENGITIVRELSQQLTEVTTRVETLQRSADGTVEMVPLGDEASGE